MLEVSDIHVRYGGIAALSGVSLSAASGEIVALLGANGAGKSTCLRTISGLERAQSGAIKVANEPIHALAAESIAARGVAHVPEHRRIFGPMTVADNLVLGAYCLGRRGRRAHLRERFEFVYALFPRLADRRAQLGGTLSGGEQQMLAIGRALMGSPRILLLDEPSIGLAPLIVDSILATLLQLRASGLCVLLVEQFAHSALDIADRAYVLRAGHVMLEGTSAELRGDSRVIDSYLGVDMKSAKMQEDAS